uniref:Uncharacterized protein n=1 Tax=Oryza brachyantha TaxID=4533 RepID=J3L0C0_ORYBR
MHHELGEGPSVAKMATDVTEALVETVEHVEYQRAISDRFPEFPELLRHGLETSAVVCDREITLNEVAKLDVEVEGACLPVSQKLGLQGEPNITGSGVALDHGLGEVNGDGAGDPGFDDIVHACPVGEVRRGEVGEDMVLERVFADDEKDLIVPAGVVAGVGVDDDVDKASDVLDADGLCVQVDDGGGFMRQDSVVKVVAVVVEGVVVLWLPVRNCVGNNNLKLYLTYDLRRRSTVLFSLRLGSVLFYTLSLWTTK